MKAVFAFFDFTIPKSYSFPMVTYFAFLNKLPSKT